MRRVLYILPLLLLCTPPAWAHQGPPFPILVDQNVGPYVASVWSDPDIGTATFFVVLEAPKGHKLPATTSVRIGVQPLTKRLPEVFYDTEAQPVDEGARYMAKIQFDKGEMWHVRVVLGGSGGGGEIEYPGRGHAGRHPRPHGLPGLRLPLPGGGISLAQGGAAPPGRWVTGPGRGESELISGESGGLGSARRLLVAGRLRRILLLRRIVGQPRRLPFQLFLFLLLLGQISLTLRERIVGLGQIPPLSRVKRCGFVAPPGS